MDIQKYHEELCEEIRRWNYEYYVLDDPSVPDSIYDEKYNELLKIEENNPGLKIDSISLKVGSNKLDSKLKEVRHSTPLLSLEKAQNEEELRSFLNKFLGETFIVQPKLDGLTVKSVYENGKHKLSATRGNGEFGEDITHSVSNAIGVPKKIDYKGSIEVRGEAIIPIEVFEKISGEYKTPRNLVAGTVRALDNKLSKSRGVEVVYYDVINGIYDSELNNLRWLEDQGFSTVEWMVISDVETVIDHCLNYDRTKLDYEIDGLVIKIASYKTREQVGSTSHHPRWAIAYKFPPIEKETILREITWQVGRSGVITPVINFDKVVISGVEITKCTGFNLDHISKFKIGDKIIVKRSNDVIPYAIPAGKRDGTETDIIPPMFCPTCKYETEINFPFLTCTNEDCKSRLIEKVIHFASRNAMDIEGLGDSIAEELVNRGLVDNVSDLYELNKSDLLCVPLFADKKADNLLVAIQNSTTREFHNLIFALGISGVGRNTSKNLANKFGSMKNLRKASYQDLIDIDDIGDITANSIIEFFSKDVNNKIIDRLQMFSVNMETEVKMVGSDKLDGLIFVITGELSKPRNDFIKIIEENSGKCTGSVSRKTHYLLAGAATGAVKVNKAKEVGTKVINEEEFWQMIS
jgi:DNA ligase (NAD+)